MAHITKSRVAETTTTTGTGPFALAGALSGVGVVLRRFSAVCSVNDTCFVQIAAVDADGNETGDWVEGLGTYSASNEITLTTVHDGSNGTSAVSFGAGTKRVLLVADERQIGAIPRGGSSGQFPVKASGTDYDVSWSSTLSVADDPYDATSWNGNTDVPTKNAIRDKIESLGGGGATYTELLTANRDYYVDAATGNDSNDGLAGNPWLTIQHASDVIAGLNLGPYRVRLFLADGDYSGEYVGLYNMTSNGPSQFIVQGNTGSPGNVQIGGLYPSATNLWIKGVQLVGDGFYGDFGFLSISDCIGVGQIRAQSKAYIQVSGSVTLSGDNAAAIEAAMASAVEVTGVVTVSGSPTYFTGFAYAHEGGAIKFNTQPSGTAVGPRYATVAGGIINTGGGGGTWLPGDSAGTDDGTGVYV